MWSGSLALDATTKAAFKGSFRLAIFFRVGLDEVSTGETPIRLWTGLYDIPARIPVYDAFGTTYYGTGKMINVPDLELLLNGVFDRIEFFVSGVDPEMSNNLETTAPPVIGAPVHIGIAAMDSRWVMLSNIIPVWMGRADYWGIVQPKVRTEETPTRTIYLSVGSGDTGRTRPRRVSFSNSQQKLVYPTDRFFNRVIRYSRDYLVAWPRF